MTEFQGRGEFGSEMTWTGGWVTGKTYRPGHVASYAGNAWICVRTHKSIVPGSNAIVWASFGNIPGSLLATVQYGPSSQATYNADVGALTVLDTANLSIAFTVPGSGNYYIDVAMDWAFATNGSFSGISDMFLGIVTHGGTVPVSPIQSWVGTTQANFVGGGRHLHRYPVSGATPGPVQLDLVMGCSNVTNLAFAAFYAAAGGALSGDPTCPALIQAFAA